MATIILGGFEWDADKAAANLAKHGVSFEDATVALQDPHALVIDTSTPDEDRLATIGRAAEILFVIHVERGPRDRIISARPATRRERALYLNR